MRLPVRVRQLSGIWREAPQTGPGCIHFDGSIGCTLLRCRKARVRARRRARCWTAVWNVHPGTCSMAPTICSRVCMLRFTVQDSKHASTLCHRPPETDASTRNRCSRCTCIHSQPVTPCRGDFTAGVTGGLSCSSQACHLMLVQIAVPYFKPVAWQHIRLQSLMHCTGSFA